MVASRRFESSVDSLLFSPEIENGGEVVAAVVVHLFKQSTTVRLSAKFCRGQGQSASKQEQKQSLRVCSTPLVRDFAVEAVVEAVVVAGELRWVLRWTNPFSVASQSRLVWVCRKAGRQAPFSD